MCGGGDPEIKETEAQKALADVALERWQSYKSMYLPAEQQYFDKVEAYNSPQYQQKAGGAAAANVESAFGQAVQADVAALTSQGTGVNPNSGTFQSAMDDRQEQSGAARAENVNQSEQAVQDAYVGGMQNIVAMGNNQSTEAIAGMGDIANRSARVAQNDVYQDQVRDQGNEAAAGMVAGAGWGAYTNTRDKQQGGMHG